ncbi:hypothetical protein DQ241_02625 [Blastococcus sp. TF02A-30]|nr:hypothetical protein DQ241_02625 [Blastococcus sp. TF02A-30]
MTAALTASALLSGCGDDDPVSERADRAASTTSGDGVTASQESASPSSDAPAFEGGDEPVTADPSGDAALTVTAIRVGAHDDHDRVVFELGGTGTPGWDVRYVDQAASQGSGDAVEVAGGEVLQVTVSGVRYPFETGLTEFSGGPVAGAGTGGVTEVVWDATFEGTSVAFVGTRERAPFRVELLTGPTRLVVDVAR